MSSSYNRCCQCNAMLAISDTCAFCYHTECTNCLATPLPGTSPNYFDVTAITPRSVPSPTASSAPLFSAVGRSVSVKQASEKRAKELREKALREKERRDEEVRVRRAERERLGGLLH